MKKVIRKNQVIITSLAILIAIAGYLNFADVDLGFGEKEASTESSSILFNFKKSKFASIPHRYAEPEAPSH